ncbi:helix-turn-helix transcriptional regulator [Mycolicibacterium sp.]|uniref:helix-turn-helix transcriptional regulator n=1 Tax=Mycolicibacterium sp. TaxID=2320850 RepID=UPI0037CCA2F1
MAVNTTPARKFDMRPKEFAELLGISQQQACDWRREGVGPDWIRLPGGKAIRYDRASVDQFLDERRRAPMSKSTNADASKQAARTVLAAVRDRRDHDTAAMLIGLKGTPSQLALRLLEAVELLNYLVSHSDRPDELLEELEARATD